MTGKTMLHHAADVFEERSAQYGAPKMFFEALAKRWSLTLGRPITPAEVVLCMIDLKLVRLGHDPKHHDSLVDVVGYSAVLHEVVR